jgi:hypothetical protein
MDVVTGRHVRKDGSRPRRYVCRAHRERPQDCDATPIDATSVDRAFVSRLEEFLGDVETWRDRLTASRTAERDRVGGEIIEAERDLARSEDIADKLRARLERALADGQEDKADALADALAHRRAEHRLVERRLRATQDALAATRETIDLDPLLEFYFALQDEIGGRFRAGDASSLKRLNAALHDYFERVELTTQPDGVQIAPLISAAAAERIASGLDRKAATIVARGTERIRPPLRVSLVDVDDVEDPPPSALLPELDIAMTPEQASEFLRRLSGDMNPRSAW